MYKYRAFDRNAISILVDQELYFASPQNLNDPHDCQIDVVEALLAALLSLDIESLPSDRAPGVKETIEYVSNDKDGIANKLRRYTTEIGICSMSMISDNPLMWSHYADEHRGICFGFDARLIQKKDGIYDLVIPSAVYYCDENPMIIAIKKFVDCTYTCSDPNKPNPEGFSLIRIAADQAIVSKSLAWAYEEELRFIRSSGANAVQFEPQALKEVILGCRMSQKDRRTAIYLLQDPKWNHVEVKEAVKLPLTPTFEIRDADVHKQG